MTVNLSKGQKVSLSKADPNLRTVKLGLGWDPRATDGKEFDLDASVFLLTSSGKVRDEKDFIFYGNLKSTDGSVEHTGDNRTGEGEGDDEVINVQLPVVPADITRIVVAVTIHEADARGQNFGQVSGSFIRLENAETGQELFKYDLGEDYSTEKAMLFGELYRNNGEWKFSAVGQGYSGGLAAVCKEYGVDAA